MDKIVLIKESDLKNMIQEAVTNAVDSVTKKIASRCAVVSYNNEIFREQRRRSRSVLHSVGGCGSDDDGGGCGGSYDYSYGGCGSSSGGGCGSSNNSGGGCGGGYSSGGC